MLCVEEWFRIRWAGTLMPDFLLVGIMVDYDVGSGLFFFLLVVLLLCFFHLWDTGENHSRIGVCGATMEWG